jgi:hypothetical protein
MQHVWGTGVVYTEFLWDNMKKTDNLKDRGLNRRTILKWIFKILDGGMDWIDQAQDTERWWALFNAEKELTVS